MCCCFEQELSYSKVGCVSNEWWLLVLQQVLPIGEIYLLIWLVARLLLVKVFILSSRFQSPSAVLSTSPELSLTWPSSLWACYVVTWLVFCWGGGEVWISCFSQRSFLKQKFIFFMEHSAALCFWSSSPFCVTQFWLGHLCSVLMTDLFHSDSPIFDGVNSLYHSFFAWNWHRSEEV